MECENVYRALNADSREPRTRYQEHPERRVYALDKSRSDGGSRNRALIFFHFSSLQIARLVYTTYTILLLILSLCALEESAPCDKSKKKKKKKRVSDVVMTVIRFKLDWSRGSLTMIALNKLLHAVAVVSPEPRCSPCRR